MSDTVEVVRCKDCQWYGNNWVSKLGSLCMHTKMRSHYEHLWVEPDFFCAHGEEYITNEK